MLSRQHETILGYTSWVNIGLLLVMSLSGGKLWLSQWMCMVPITPWYSIKTNVAHWVLKSEWKRTISKSVRLLQQTGFLVPPSTWSILTSINNDCLLLLSATMDLRTQHYTSTHGTSLSHQHTAREEVKKCDTIVLNWHIVTLPGYAPEVPELQNPSYATCMVIGCA